MSKILNIIIINIQGVYNQYGQGHSQPQTSVCVGGGGGVLIACLSGGMVPGVKSFLFFKVIERLISCILATFYYNLNATDLVHFMS